MLKLKMISAAVLVAAAGAASAAGVSLSTLHAGVAPTKAKPAASQSLAGVLYDQTAGDSGIAIVSQNFEASFDAYDAQAADDFVVPAGKTWKVSAIDVPGAYFNGAGPAASVHITFYKSKGGKPGAVVADFPAITGGDNGLGSFALTLPNTVKLKAGTYWVSAQVNMDFLSGAGEWGWENSTIQTNSAAVWQNPGDGFGTGCTSYQTEQDCIPSGQGPDHLFALRGKAK